MKKFRLWMTAITISHFSWLMPSSSAQTRIMLISDPHVMGPGLLINEGSAWEEALSYDRKLNDYSLAIYDEVIAIALREKPDLFMISGDLTKDGELLSHQYVAEKLKELKAAGIKAYVIPGNHDMGTTEAWYFDGDDLLMAEVVNAQKFAELYQDFGYGEDFQRESTTLTYCCEPVEGLVLIGIDTGHDGDLLNGVISETTLNWVCDRAEEATAAGKQVLVMMHHSLFPHVAHVEKLSSTYAVKYGVRRGDGSYDYQSYKIVRDRLMAAGVRVVLSGHTHALDAGKDANEGLTAAVYDVCTATCAAFPNPYRMMTLSEDKSRLDIETRYIRELPGVDNFAEMAEQRMIDGLMTLAMQYTYEKDRARLGADIFMLHVKGNEPHSALAEEYRQMFQDNLPAMKEDAQVLDVLYNYQITFDEVEEMVNGMLDDKTNYGDLQRVSKLDDLKLSIDLREEGWTAIRPVVSEKGDDGWYTLQGLPIARPQKRGVYIHRGRLVVNR